jgi:hypothetical protein
VSLCFSSDAKLQLLRNSQITYTQSNNSPLQWNEIKKTPQLEGQDKQLLVAATSGCHLSLKRVYKAYTYEITF